MNRPARIHLPVLASLTFTWVAAAWMGCATSSEGNTTDTTTSTTTSSGEGGSAGAGGNGSGGDIGGFDGGVGGADDGGACAYTTAEAHRIPLDIVVLLDRSGSMSGTKWIGTKNALSAFFNDPASAGIGAGLVYFPAQKPDVCNPITYAALDVPINVLPDNAFALTNSMPFDALGSNTPTYAGLKGALLSATAYQDAHPTHKVVAVLATDGDPTGCLPTVIDEIASLATSARNYNGVRTYVIGVAGSTLANLNKIAAAGGTTAAYDVTQDISAFAAKMAEIRTSALGCDFELPPPPNGQELDTNRVNFTYLPKGAGLPKILPRADDLADCNNQPGWYYDSNVGPTKIILCPSSCATVQSDNEAKVNVLFGCNTITN